jgi:hypothetical protein
MDTLREALNLAEEFSAGGRKWVELDDDGTVVERVKASGRRSGTRAAG